jgi:hypothetical protein
MQTIHSGQTLCPDGGLKVAAGWQMIARPTPNQPSAWCQVRLLRAIELILNELYLLRPFSLFFAFPRWGQRQRLFSECKADTSGQERHPVLYGTYQTAYASPCTMALSPIS